MSRFGMLFLNRRRECLCVVPGGTVCGYADKSAFFNGLFGFVVFVAIMIIYCCGYAIIIIIIIIVVVIRSGECLSNKIGIAISFPLEGS